MAKLIRKGSASGIGVYNNNGVLMSGLNRGNLPKHHNFFDDVEDIEEETHTNKNSSVPCKSSYNVVCKPVCPLPIPLEKVLRNKHT
jgi:hypothetical protein